MSEATFDPEEYLKEEIAELLSGRILVQMQHRDSRTGEVRPVVSLDVDPNDTLDVVLRGVEGGEEIHTFSFTEQNQRQMVMERNARNRRSEEYLSAEEALYNALNDHYEEIQYQESAKYFDDLPRVRQVEIVDELIDEFYQKHLTGPLGKVRRILYGIK